MSDPVLASVQQKLADAGFYHGNIDGTWGPISDNALIAALAASTVRNQVAPPSSIIPAGTMAWGAKVSLLFRSRVNWICTDLGVPVDDLMGCMAWESGGTFRADVKNAAGSGAVGLIQFMPTTAAGLGTTTAALAAMTAEDQLNYVYKYFLPYKGKLHNLGDLYMAILWPAGVSQPDTYVLFDRDDPNYPKRYAQNAGIDIDKNGKVTKAEAYAKVAAKRSEGLRAPNFG